MLSAGNVSDVTAAPALLGQVRPARYLVADKGYDADRLHTSLHVASIIPVFLAAATASVPSAMIGAATAAAT